MLRAVNFEMRRHGCVHHIAKRFLQYSRAIQRNNRTGKQRGPIVRRLPAFAANQRDGDADENRGRRHRVGPVVHGLDIERRAVRRDPRRAHAVKDALLASARHRISDVTVHVEPMK